MKKFAVCLCSDKDMMWQSFFALERLIRHCARRDVAFFYFHSDPIPEAFRPLIHPSVQTVATLPATRADRDEAEGPRLTSAHFLRLTAIEQITQEFERVLYLDADVFLRWGDVSDLALLDLAEKPLAAVRDISLWFGAPHGKNRAYHAGLPENVQGHYFNSGVLLVQSRIYRDLAISSRAIALWETNPELCKFGDQSALNRVVDGNWAELSAGWNWQAILPVKAMIASRNPRLVHFVGHTKPWQDPLFHQEEIYWFLMQQYLARHGLEDEIRSNRRCLAEPLDERKRSRQQRDLYGDPFQTRKLLQTYLDREDFTDCGQGIAAFRTEDLTLDA